MQRSVPIKKTICLLFMLLMAAQAQTTDFVIAADTTLDSNLVVPAGSTCTVLPGVDILFAGYGRVVVKGILIAQGTSANPITFSTVNRPRGSDAKPTWRGMEMSGALANGRFVNCRFEGAFRNLVWESSPLFDSCTFIGNQYGLYCARQARPVIRNSVFSRNVVGITSDCAAPILLDNMITANQLGVLLQQSSRGIIGRNTISGNTNDIKSEQALGANKESLSLHYLWNVMSQLY